MAVAIVDRSSSNSDSAHTAHLSDGQRVRVDQRQPNLSPRPASSASPPVLIENVSQIQSESGDGTFALRKPLMMNTQALRQFNREISSSAAYSSWFKREGGAAVGFGTTTVTVRGNAVEPVRIVDLRADKRCGAPFSGSYFAGYSQGSPETVRLGLDLDKPEPDAQAMAVTDARGLFPLGEDYFATKTITLSPGESETLSVGAFTKQHSCEFKLKLFVATSHGEVYETVDDERHPFVVTATAPARKSADPLSGYSTAYALTPNVDVPPSWKRVNPATYRGR